MQFLFQFPLLLQALFTILSLAPRFCLHISRLAIAIMHSSAWILASCLIPLTTAHFLLNYPASRGFSEDQLSQFPCGGQSTVSPNRTLWPLTGGPVQLNMQHDRVAVQVLLGLGNDVGSNFNITLMPIFAEEGFGDFCMGNVVNITMNLDCIKDTDQTSDCPFRIEYQRRPECYHTSSH